LASGLRALGDPHIDRAVGQLGANRRTERGFPGRNPQRRVDVAALDAIAAMRLEVNFEIEIARGALAAARSALAGQADDLTLVDALRDANLQIALGERHAPLVVDLRRAQRDHARGTAIGVLERQQDLRVMILAAYVHARSARAGTAEQL